MSRRDDETEEWLKRALTKALGHTPDDHTVLSALVHAGCPPTLRYRRGMQRLVGRALCSECRQQQPALTCFDNDPDDGSCGWQVCDQCLRGALPAVSGEPMVKAKIKLLYVEDESYLATPMIEMLEHRGYDVVHSMTARQAIALLNEVTFDAVITDWQLIGAETGGAVAEEAQRRQVPVRIYSASLCPEARWSSIWLDKGYTRDLLTFLASVPGAR